MKTQETRQQLMRWLVGSAVFVGIAAVGLTAKVFLPLILATTTPPPAEPRVELPAYDVAAWHSLPVMHGGRIKPFESACRETLLKTTGRSKFQGQDPVAIVLTWRLLGGTNAGPGKIDWEHHPFIKCTEEGLRKLLYEDLVAKRRQAGEEPPPDNWVQGTHVAPSDLYESPTFLRLCTEVEELRMADRDKAQHAMSPEQREAEQVEERLITYLSVTQHLAATFPSELRPQGLPRDPFNFVALDRVRGAGWLSLKQLHDLKANPDKWHELMRERVAETPDRYLPPDCQEELKKFQDHLKGGTAEAALEELQAARSHDNEEAIQAFRKRHPEAEADLTGLVREPLLSDLTSGEAARLHKLVEKKGDTPHMAIQPLARELDGILADRLAEQIDGIRQQIAGLKGIRYRPADQRFRMVHLYWLEARYPDIYRRSQAWQDFPTGDADRVLAAYEGTQKAYEGGDGAAFAVASTGFFDTLRNVSSQFDDYPGVKTLDLEMQLNRVQPFGWGWIIMLGAAALFLASMMLRSRILYGLAFAAYLGSLAFQIFGFYARVSISGRAPVSDMYETVIWVAFMSAVFALALELIYRRRYIGLAGALVATFGLILADNTVLDSTLKPLQPVLRSNFWLTVHVLTEVSSYAGGALAWGLGNLTLGLLAFGTPRRDLLKTLASYTYRGMQIAVLLLAVGTFLGAWWAYDSWGRYWGWDPKEVWALIALVAYVIPLHMRYIGWVREFGTAVSAVICFAVIIMSWYGVNFVLGAGLHSYGFGGGGPWWVFWAGLLNLEWVLIASILYLRKLDVSAPVAQVETPSLAPVSSPLPETGFRPGLGNA
jgi:ABC-type transport system involved in cytochrome c biogenesis permease subunit